MITTMQRIVIFVRWNRNFLAIQLKFTIAITIHNRSNLLANIQCLLILTVVLFSMFKRQQDILLVIITIRHIDTMQGSTLLQYRYFQSRFVLNRVFIFLISFIFFNFIY